MEYITHARALTYTAGGTPRHARTRPMARWQWQPARQCRQRVTSRAVSGVPSGQPKAISRLRTGLWMPPELGLFILATWSSRIFFCSSLWYLFAPATSGSTRRPCQWEPWRQHMRLRARTRWRCGTAGTICCGTGRACPTLGPASACTSLGGDRSRPAPRNMHGVSATCWQAQRQSRWTAVANHTWQASV